MDEELLPPIGVVAKKLSSPMEVVDEKLPYQGVFTEQTATPNLKQYNNYYAKNGPHGGGMQPRPGMIVLMLVNIY